MSSKKPLVVGERAAAYLFHVKHGAERVTGVVTFSNPSRVRLEHINGGSAAFDFHPKQCRRLERRPRRSVFIQKDAVCDLDKYSSVLAWPNARGCSDYIEFREVRK